MILSVIDTIERSIWKSQREATTHPVQIAAPPRMFPCALARSSGTRVRYSFSRSLSAHRSMASLQLVAHDAQPQVRRCSAGL